MSDLIAELQAKTAEMVAQAKEPLARRIAELEAALAQRDRMLRLACIELEKWEQSDHDQSGDGFTALTPDVWLADLRRRALEETP